MAVNASSIHIQLLTVIKHFPGSMQIAMYIYHPALLRCVPVGCVVGGIVKRNLILILFYASALVLAWTGEYLGFSGALSISSEHSATPWQKFFKIHG